MISEQLLTPAQVKQIEKQALIHRACTAPAILDPIILDETQIIEGLVIRPGVLRPMSSRRLAAFLYQHRGIFKGKSVIDIGSGCGIQGIVAAQHGASSVILSDVREEAYCNTSDNVRRLGLENICDVRKGDLFENVPESADFVIFAQPYFPGAPDPNEPYTYGMLDEGDLIHRFLEEAKEHAKEKTYMCYLDLAGDQNNPALQAPKHGFKVVEHGPELLSSGEQQGRFWVHELSHVG